MTTSKDLYTQGTKVWIPDPDDVWQSATITADYRTGVLIVKADKDANIVQIKIKDDTSLPPLRNPSILLGQNDLTSLSYLHEPAVIHNLRVRFIDRNAIYTYCGIVLVAINPYCELPLYGEDCIKVYHGHSLGELDPHIFAVAEEAYSKLEQENKDQSIIVSGESGAGKTVSAKYAMRYFATVGGTSSDTNIEKKVLASSPITESIGNAKTTRNDNSSRFGKFISIGLDNYFRICGASLRTYLLEKSRVVYQAPGERNYHIFYQLCDVRDQYPELRLDHPDAFHYLNQGGEPKIQGVDDSKDFNDTMRALVTLGFSEQDTQDMLVVLSVILHLGNVQFHSGDPDYGGGDDGAFISAKDSALATVCELLGVSKPELTRWLTHRRIASGSEVIISRWSKEAASAGRDALAKLIYARLFAKTVASVNQAIDTSIKEYHHIGVLDIYGFETFEINSFEQFCINYANEKLQQQFNQHVFKLEQEEYIKEEIEWTMITFYDNQPCIELIEGRLGILSLLDEECKVPGGSDKAFAGKLRTKCNQYKHFAQPRFGNTTFIVKHFADDVEYDTGGFLEKNRDAVSEELVDCFKTSTKCGIMFELCSGEDESNLKQHNTLPVPQRRKPNLNVQSATQPPRRASGNRLTVGAQFKSSLTALMATLSATTPHYVRCIKPNDTKSPFVYEAPRVASQLRACGVLETIRISAAGYPSRWLYQDFFNRYRLLCHSKEVKRSDPKQTCKTILSLYISDVDKFRFGLTKIFFRAGQVAYLEKLRAEKQRRSCILIQSNVRRFIARNRYLKIMLAIRGLQAHGRGYLARRRADQLRRIKACIVLQRHWRGRRERVKYNQIKRTVVGLQAHARGLLARRKYRDLKLYLAVIEVQRYARGYLARQRCKKRLSDIITCQAAIRRFLARRQYKRLRVEARSLEHVKKLNNGLENKIISLQQRLQCANDEIKLIKPKLSQLEVLKASIQAYTHMEQEFKQLQKSTTEKDTLITSLQGALECERDANNNMREEIGVMKSKYESERDSFMSERDELQAELERYKVEVQKNIEDREKRAEEERRTLVQQLEEERASRQKLLAAQYDLQEQIEKLRSEQTKEHRRSLSDASSNSQPEHNQLQEDDYGYGSVRSTDTVRPALEAVNWTAGQQAVGNGATNNAAQPAADAGLVLRLQRKLSSLQSELSRTSSHARALEERLAARSTAMPGLATKETFRLSELEIENNRLKSRLNGLITATDVGKEIKDQLSQLQQELVRRREECEQLRTVLANQSVNLKSLTSGSAIPHDEGEMVELFEAQKRVSRQLEEELIAEKKLYRDTLNDYKMEIDKLKNENYEHVKLLSAPLSEKATTAAEQFAQKEIVRIAAENQALQERVEKLSESCRRYKAQLRVLADRLENAGIEDVQLILDSDPSAMKSLNDTSLEMLPMLKRKEREYMGMFEFTIANRTKIIKKLIYDLSPQTAITLLPCLPAYILFMMVRYLDHADDEPNMQHLVKALYVAVKKVVRKKQDEVDYVTMWLANMLRLLNNVRQYSGEEAFSKFNTPQQELQCLRMFDLSEYRQVLSDTAVWIYHLLIAVLEKSLEVLIVPAVLEYEEVAGIMEYTGGKKTPTSPCTPVKLAQYLSDIYDRLKLFNIGPDLIIRIFKQLVYFICAYSLNQLLMRKDLCCWAKGLQIRYNVSHLEVWIKENLSGLQGEISVEEILALLRPITESVHLLQARKTMDDVQSITDMCPSLTTMQVCKILNMYTTSEEYEQKVTREFINAIQKQMQTRPNATAEQESLLMDIKLKFSVQFPFEPSPIRLEDIEIPDVLGLVGLLTKL